MISCQSSAELVLPLDPATGFLQAYMKVLVSNLSTIEVLDGVQCSLKVSVVDEADATAPLGLFLMQHLHTEYCPIRREPAETKHACISPQQ